MGYISGAYDMNEYVIEETTCVPPDIRPDQLMAVVHKYLLDNPALLQETASMLVYNAIINEWRCPE